MIGSLQFFSICQFHFINTVDRCFLETKRCRYTYLISAYRYKQLDGCIVWNEHNTVFGSKATCAEAVYFLHSTMPSVTFLRLSDVSVICHVTYLQFPIQACLSSMSVSQAAQRLTWFTQYRISNVAENLVGFLYEAYISG